LGRLWALGGLGLACGVYDVSGWSDLVGVGVRLGVSFVATVRGGWFVGGAWLLLSGPRVVWCGDAVLRSLVSWFGWGV